MQLCIAAYSGEPSGDLVACARRLIDALRGEAPNATLLLGGYRGLMRVVVDYALEAGFRVVLVIPRDYEGDMFPRDAIVIRTGADVRARSTILCRSCNALIALGGGVGTIMEVVTAYSYGVPVVLVTGYGLPSDRLAEAYPDGVLDPRLGFRVRYVGDCAEAARVAVKLVQ